MNSSRENTVQKAMGNAGKGLKTASKNEFRNQFKRALLQCVKHGFSVEECFGMVWMEILDSVRLPEAAQPEIYEELIAWAKKRVN
jgi:hypothetical protein